MGHPDPSHSSPKEGLEWGTRVLTESQFLSRLQSLFHQIFQRDSHTFAFPRGPAGLDLNRPFFSGGVVPEAAPWPVFGFLDQSTLDRIAVDVSHLLYLLLRRTNIEVVVTFLPEVFATTYYLTSYRLLDRLENRRHASTNRVR